MHEMSLMADLFRKIEQVAREHRARKIVKVKVTLGALSHLSPDHFREHFEHASRGTVAEDASLEIAVQPNAQEILLESVEAAE